ncbi:MAG: L-histidine N(alpha)-methyltransferase [Burkholderiales bacterium]|nr:L-histidine N(alpha)-methyltransferase [Burkholderiales bacterium]
MPIPFIETLLPQTPTLQQEAELGILSTPAHLPPKFFYDDLGSRLFEAITYLPEYYLTATEESIFNQFGAEIQAQIGAKPLFIDLGAGNCQKAARFFDLLKPNLYVAIDFSIAYLRTVLSHLQGEYPTVPMMGIGMDFSQQLRLPPEVPQTPRTFFYPGSSLGNFSPAEALQLLKQIHRESLGGALLIGVDLFKSAAILEPAYNDLLLVTAAFNLNILRNVNQLLGSNFEVAKFKHHIDINTELMRVELYLEALEANTVQWQGKVRHFKKGERIHTENSHKYSLSSIQQLLTAAGFDKMKVWTDPQQYYAVIYAA